MTFSDLQKKQLISLARESIRAHLEHRQPVLFDVDPELNVNAAAFVTLHKDGGLRGCIGSITAGKPLSDTVREMAFESAFDDPRFAPLSLPELNKIDIEISVLSGFTQISSPDEIIPGTHGLYIKNGAKTGLLLPQVAREHKWDRDTFLAHLCYKAGLLGDVWKSTGSELYTFTAVIVRETELA